MATLLVVIQHFSFFTTVVVLLVFVPQQEPAGIVQNIFTLSDKQLLWNQLLKTLICSQVIPGIPPKGETNDSESERVQQG